MSDHKRPGEPWDGDPSDEELLALARPVKVAAWLRDREGDVERTLTVKHGSASTPDELEKLDRRIVNRGGRLDDRTSRLAEYRTAILALADKHYREGEITARRILQHIGLSSESLLRKDMAAKGGLKLFRVEVLRSR